MSVQEHIQSILRVLPHDPGVYQYFDSEGKVIYVGKAIDLKNRVSSYFRKTVDRGKTRVLVQHIVDIKYMVVESEMDALLLENSLIKKYQPRYNILLKDDKTYPSIVIKNEAFPRIYATRQRIKDGSEYLGPYTSARVMHGVLDLMKKIFPIRTCSLNLSDANIAAKKFKVCLEYHLGNCLGPCEGKQNRADYEANVQAIRKIVSGNYNETLREFRRHLKESVAEYRFEQAHEIQSKIELLEGFQAKSTIVNPGIHNVDVFSIVSDKVAGFVNYMKINNGVVVHGYTAEFRKRLDETDTEILEHAILMLRDRFNSNSNEIYLPFDAGIAMEGIRFTVPQKGDKKKLVELSERNAKLCMIDSHKQQEFVDPERHVKRIMETLKSDLRMPEMPVHIECFDNSNIQGTNAVGACVVFKNAKPSKADYRIFNIQTVQGPDDFESMREVVFRRYSRLIEEAEPIPQLIIIDGGKGQLSAAVSSLEKLGLWGKVTIIGIAKKLEEIYFPGDTLPIYIDKKSESLKLIQQLRNEAHRFGITRHRQKRSKEALRSELTDIKGIGQHTAQTLLFHFKTVQKVREASLEELEKIVNKRTARILSEYFDSQAEK